MEKFIRDFAGNGNRLTLVNKHRYAGC